MKDINVTIDFIATVQAHIMEREMDKENSDDKVFHDRIILGYYKELQFLSKKLTASLNDFIALQNTVIDMNS